MKKIELMYYAADTIVKNLGPSDDQMRTDRAYIDVPCRMEIKIISGDVVPGDVTITEDDIKWYQRRLEQPKREYARIKEVLDEMKKNIPGIKFKTELTLPKMEECLRTAWDDIKGTSETVIELSPEDANEVYHLLDDWTDISIGKRTWRIMKKIVFIKDDGTLIEGVRRSLWIYSDMSTRITEEEIPLENGEKVQAIIGRYL